MAFGTVNIYNQFEYNTILLLNYKDNQNMLFDKQ